MSAVGGWVRKLIGRGHSDDGMYLDLDWDELPGQWVARKDGRVVDAAPDAPELMRRLESYGVDAADVEFSFEMPDRKADRLGRRAVRAAGKPAPLVSTCYAGSPLPLDQAARAALRERLRPIMRTQRSLRCSGVHLSVPGGHDYLGQHAGEWRGCTNDGTGCLCECHDRQVAPPVST